LTYALPLWPILSFAAALPLKVKPCMHPDSAKLLWDAQRAAQKIARFSQINHQRATQGGLR
jgi:hypothetical protein